MRKTFQLDALDAPLYIRWSPDRSLYAIELRLDLVSKISNALGAAQKQGTEIGGVLVGSTPDAYMPTLRVEDVELITRNGSDGGPYLSDAELEARFAETRWGIRGSGRAAVGLFRSQLRPGTLRPSLADRGLLATEFKQGIFVALLVQAKAPNSAVFFIANGGVLPDEPAVREFRFNEAEFRSLPEVQPNAAGAELEPEGQRRQKWRMYGLIAVLLLIGASACLLMWSFTKRTTLSQWFHSGNQLNLAVAANDGLLRISWNHSARELDGAAGAMLTITDGTSRREIKLGLDELRLGTVEYDRRTPGVEVTMTIDKPGTAPLSESAGWGQKVVSSEAGH